MFVIPKMTINEDGELETVTLHGTAFEEPKATLENNHDGTFTLMEDVDIFIIDLMFADILTNDDYDSDNLENVFCINVGAIQQIEGVNVELVKDLDQTLTEDALVRRLFADEIEAIWNCEDEEEEQEEEEEDEDILPF